MSTKISGSKYAAMYGPTTGDKVRLADTSLVIEVEKDYTTYGDEVKFGGGKTIRDGMGQSVKTCSKDGDLDLVITNALIVDSTGIVKADIGIKDGKIAGIGKAGNPDIMDGVTPGMTVGASTEALAGEGMIVTAGGIDTHIHFISPQQIDCALYSGVTTMIGGGTGPADGTNATTCTPGPWNLKMMLKAAEEYPMNLGFLGKGNCSDEAPLIEQVKAGAMGLKIHEDWGATPAVINHCLNVADEYDVQVAIHTDTLNEVPYDNIEKTIAFLGEHGLMTGGTGAKVRPVVSCKGTTCQYGLIDTFALSKKIHERFYVGYHDVVLPHKFKIAVGGCPNNCVKPNLNDMGIIGQRIPKPDAEKCRGCKKCQIEKSCPVHVPKLVDGKLYIDPEECIHCGRCKGKCPFGAVPEYQNGYKIYIGGRWGKRISHGQALTRIFTEEEEVMAVIEKAILLFKNEGIAGERFADTVKRLGFEYVNEKLIG